MDALSLYKKRRTQYALGKQISLSTDAITDLIQNVVRDTPSAFNSQSSRVVLLFGEHSNHFWTDLVTEALRPLVPADAFATTQTKLAGFAAGVGTVLFFEDQQVISQLQEQFPLYADKFPVFSENSAGMAQFAVWTALAEQNIGASLQHYNPVIDEAVHAAYDIPTHWQLSAQMPFGSNEQGFNEKTYIDDSTRFKVFR